MIMKRGTAFSCDRYLKRFADMLPDAIVLKKDCSFARCDGIMHFHDKNPAHWHHDAEWPWYATWVCSKQPAHIEIVTDHEYEEICRQHREGERAQRHQQRYQVAASHRNPKRRGLLRRIADWMAKVTRSEPR